MSCYFQTPRLAMKYPDLLDGSSSVTNLTLACGDGSLASHKILVAGVSSLIKNILADIPIGDDVTLILPDFTVAEVDMFLKSVTLKEETNNFDLSLALGRNVNIPFTVRANEEGLSGPVEEKIKVEIEEEVEEKIIVEIEEEVEEEPQKKEYITTKARRKQNLKEGLHYLTGGTRMFTVEEEKSLAKRFLEECQGGNDLTSRQLLRQIITEEVSLLLKTFPERQNLAKLKCKTFQWSTFLINFASRNGLHDHIKIGQYGKKDQPNMEMEQENFNEVLDSRSKASLAKSSFDYAACAKALNIDIDKNIAELEKELAHTPHRKKQKLLEKEINVHRAVSDLIKGSCSSERKAALKWGVGRSALQKLLHYISEGKRFGERGGKSKVFTIDEEERVLKKALEMSNGGENLSIKILVDAAKEEFAILQVNDPEKNMTKRQWIGFAYGFMGRHNLTEVVKAASARRRENLKHECDLCGLRFSFKNGVENHRKLVHFL